MKRLLLSLFALSSLFTGTMFCEDKSSAMTALEKKLEEAAKAVETAENNIATAFTKAIGDNAKVLKAFEGEDKENKTAKYTDAIKAALGEGDAETELSKKLTSVQTEQNELVKKAKENARKLEKEIEELKKQEEELKKQEKELTEAKTAVTEAQTAVTNAEKALKEAKKEENKEAANEKLTEAKTKLLETQTALVKLVSEQKLNNMTEMQIVAAANAIMAGEQVSFIKKAFNKVYDACSYVHTIGAPAEKDAKWYQLNRTLGTKWVRVADVAAIAAIAGAGYYFRNGLGKFFTKQVPAGYKKSIRFGAQKVNPIAQWVAAQTAVQA